MQAELAQQSPALEPEEQARADWYGLLARLWYAAPDASLLEAIGQGTTNTDAATQSRFDAAWHELVQAAGRASATAVRFEYDTVFVGIGKAEVPLYMSHYLSETVGKEQHLVHLRSEFIELGITRAEKAHEPEDHFAALCEVMRHLILAGGGAEDALTRQAGFFNRYLAQSYAGLVAGALASPNTDFYKSVARFTEAFFDIEVQSFDMF